MMMAHPAPKIWVYAFYYGGSHGQQDTHTILINSFPASGDFCSLLITFANSLDPDQARQNVGPDLDPNCLPL